MGSAGKNIHGHWSGDEAEIKGFALIWLLMTIPWGTVIAGFFTGGALAVRGGMKAARNSAIGCACLLAVIEGVGIGVQRLMAENTRLDVSSSLFYVLVISVTSAHYLPSFYVPLDCILQFRRKVLTLRP